MENPTIYGILPDHEIKTKILITPMFEGEKRSGKISYGTTSYGYDARLGYKFKLYSNTKYPSQIVDPKNISDKSFIDIEPTKDKTGEWVLIPPNSYLLGETMEFFEIPRDVLAICVGKSTYARCGIIVCCTPLEPSWKGKITIEMSNAGPLPAKVYAGEGIMQIIFFRSPSPCERSYEDKKGIYQSQTELTLPRVEKNI